MKNTLINVFLFAAGAVIGSAVTNAIVRKKYERIADEEIASVKEVYSRRAEKKEETDEGSEDESESETEEISDEMKALVTILTDEKYYQDEKGGDVPMKKNKPYIISDEEFGKKDGYELEYLTCFADKVLTDREHYEIEDPEELIGEGTLELFDELEHEDGEEVYLFVRNDEKEIDIEIVLDERTYESVLDLEETPQRVD